MSRQRHDVQWSAEETKWVCSCGFPIADDKEARRHYELDIDRRTEEREWLVTRRDDEGS